MAQSPARRRATDKYIKEKCDEIKVRVSKGDKESITAHAQKQGESLNGFVNRSIIETIERDNATDDNAPE